MSQITSSDLEYWTDRLRDKEQCFFPVLDDGVGGVPKKIQTTSVQAPPVKQLLEFCQNFDLRLSTVFQAAWGLLLRSYTGADDVIFGYREDHWSTLPCHMHLVPESNLRHALNSIEVTFGRDASHREFTRRELYSALKMGDDELFNTELCYRDSIGNLQNQEYEKMNMLEDQDFSDRSPVTVEIATNLETGFICINLRYMLSQLSPGQAGNVGSALEKALICVITGSQQTVGEQHLFSDYHRQQVDQWNRFRPEAQNMTLHDVISIQVQARPDTLAIDAWDKQLTYRQLDHYSSILARYLLQQGVRRGLKVPLVFEKSAWWVVSLLAVSKTGAAFVPVDASQPVFRLKEIMDDVKPSILLSSIQHSELLADCVKSTIVVSEILLEQLSTVLGDLPDLPIVEHTSIAYVMYTSGSTGRPKGAMMPHSGYLSALLRWVEGTNLVPGQRVLQCSSYAWSVCIIETTTALRHGACLCVPSDFSKQNALTEIFEDLHITWAILSPSISKMIEPEKVHHLQSLILCGEPVAKEVVSRWASDQTKVWVAWAATECLVLARTRSFTANSNVQNLGPCEGLCRVVEAGNHERQVPIGAVGEIVTHGPWIAHGYLNDTKRTATTFLDRPDWLDGHPSTYGSRWYRVGDLVRQNSDGSLILAGRGDNMVKIRGQRFDMAEVERKLGTDSQIRNSLPILPKKGICKHRLVAVISLHRFTTTEDEGGEGIVLLRGSELKIAASWVSEFREDLARRLPTYMIPTIWILVKKFPLTITGKIDRVFLKKFIEKMDVETFESITSLGVECEPPVNEMESYLQEVWAEVLNLPSHKIGRNTSFITLGGDSILAMIVGARCNKRNIRIRAQDILKYGTIAKLAFKANPEEDEPTIQATALAKQYIEVHGKIRKTLHEVVPHAIDVEDAYPASPMQVGMLLSKARLTGDYNTSTVYELLPLNSEPSVDIEKLRNAWQQVVNRHSILRTFFVESICQTGSFDQVVLRNYDVFQTTTVWKRMNSNALEDVIRAFSDNPCKSYPDFQPPHNLTILETMAGRVFCRLNAEHTLVDGVSLAVIVRDLRLAYDGKLSAAPVALYSTYITSLQRVVCSIDNRYWKSYLEGLHPCILPTLSYTLSREPPKAESRSINVDIKNPHHLLKFCQSQEITLSALFRTIWGLLLRSYTGSDEVCFGYITSGRDLPISGIEEMVGPFINMLVCRMNLSEMSFVKDIIATAKTDYLNSLPHQHASLAQIQHVLGLYGQRLFNTSMTILKQIPLDSGNGATIAFNNIHEWSPNEYDLDVQVWVSDTNIAMELWYRTEIISNEHAHNIATAFSHAIDTITDDFDQRVGQVDLFSQHHRRQVWEWNARCPETIDTCLHDIISQHAIVRPDAVAITSWDHEYTYAKLESHSDRLAHHLVSLGVGPEIHVLLCFEKSAIAIVAMLGVLKAGGVCVSIDPAHPTQRLQRIISDTQPLCCLTSKLHKGLFDNKGLVGLIQHVFTVDYSLFEYDSLAKSKLGKPCPTVTSKNSAFILFTSGSTGTPKGIVHEHRNVASSLHHHGIAMNIGVDSRTLQFSAFVFDVSITEIFMALTRGGVLCVPSEHERMNCLETAITRMGANWAHLTPTVASLLDPNKVPTLKHMALAGEPLKKINVTEWAPRLELVNLYGPAECCLATTLRVGLVADDRPDNIGRAVGLLVWIVSPSDTDRLVPVGGIGELLLEGPNVARQYLKDRERTLAAFIENPAWLGNEKTTPPRRFYRSGDLARYNGDGSIQILGRIDTQVKLHGQRVELGEIEYQLKVHLTPHNLVNMAVVYAKSEHPGGGLLVAFLEFDEKADDIDQEQLMLSISSRLKNILANLDTHLAELLPSYMVPSHYITLNAMPLLTAGKIDRGKLIGIVKGLSQDRLAIYSLSDFQAEKIQPRTRMERTLQSLWSRVLGLNDKAMNIGVDDNFFRLGGDSVVAMKLSAAGREAGITITVANIFQNAKLRDMAAIAKPFGERTVHELDTRYGISKTSVVSIYPATPLQEGMMLLSSKQSRVYVVQHVLPLSRDIDIEKFKTAWNVLYKQHAILRTRIISVEHTLGSMQVVLDQDIHWLTGSSLSKYLANDQNSHMDYGKSLSRFSLIEDEGSKYFVFTAHHSIFDKHTLEALFLEAEKLYHSFTIDEPPSLPSQRIEYESFATDLFNMNISAAEAFWSEQFSNATFSNFPQVPIGHQPSASATLDLFVACSFTTERQVSVQTIIRAAWALLLAQYADSQEIVVFGMALDGLRSTISTELSNIGGPTLATVPVKTLVDRQLAVGDFLDDLELQISEIEHFQHFGLQNIKTLTPGAAQACDFQVLLAIHPPRSDDAVQSRFFSGALTEHEGSPAYLLQIECQPTSRGIHVKAKFDPVVTSSTQMQRMLAQFEHVFGQLHDGDQTSSVGKIEYCSAQDVQDITNWNLNLPTRRNECVHDVISSQDPKNMAVRSWDGALTYQDLDDLSTKLAYYLKTHFGVGPETIVPLTFAKSIWTVVAMISVLKAGGAYVPMDPSHPPSRLQDIVKASQANLILCSTQYEGLARSLAENALVINQKTINLCKPHKGVVDSAVTSENTCYVIFTSGSTGTPKGVVMEHGAFSTAATEHGRRLNLNAESKVIHFSSYAFEACILEILTTLFNGGCVCIAPDSERLEDISKTMREFQVNWAFFTPSFIRTIHPEQVPDLKTLVLGGEALGLDNIDTWVDRVRLINGYGPSETCVFSVANNSVRRGDKPDLIGNNIGGACWIVDPDDHSRLAPVGAVGELLIEGNTLARGYLNDMRKTDEVFVENSKLLLSTTLMNNKPIAVQSNRFANGYHNGLENGHKNGHVTNGKIVKRMMYKTGDLVRYNTDLGAEGMIRFVGRKDTQVKVRGQRMELGDIEHHLKSVLKTVMHVAVEQVSLSSREDHFLAAFFNQENPSELGSTSVLPLPMIADLKQSLVAADIALNETLPSYMIPALYIPLSRMPLSSSGKTNRRELHRIALHLSESEISQYTLSDEQKRVPESPREQKIAKLWKNLLHLGKETAIGLDDNFFRLGGDSIAAMKLTTIAREHKVLLNVATVFKHPKLEDMAAASLALRDEEDTGQEPFILLPEPGNIPTILDKISRDYDIFLGAIENVYPAGPLQEGLMLLSIKHPGSYMSQITLSLQDNVDLTRFKLAWQQTAERNAILRTRFAHTDSGSVQFIVKEDIRWSHSSNLDTYLTEDKKQRMNLGDPLVRYAIVDDHNGDRHFVLTAHHSLYDGWSLMLIMEDFDAIFVGTRIRPAAPSYAGFIKHLTSIDLHAAESFWHTQFTGKSLASYPEPRTVPQAPVESQIFRFTDIERPPGSDITLSTIIRASWALLIARYADTRDVFFGAVLMGRNASLLNIERMTGPTITTLPICVSINTSETVIRFLERVQNQGIDMIPFEHTGLQNIKSFGKEAEQACSFQNLLVIQPEGSEDLKSNIWKEKALFAKGEMVTMTYALIVECRLYKDKARITAQYREHVISTLQMQRMLDQFASVMQSLNSASAGRLIGDVELVSKQDKEEIVRRNNIGKENVPIDDCIHYVIKRKVEEQPEAPAIESWDGSFSYVELDEVSTRLAHYLTSLGVGHDSYVPLCFDKSAWTVVAILAVLKTGAAYLSLGPKDPRKEHIIREVQAKLILTSTEHMSLFEASGLKVVVIDESSMKQLEASRDTTFLPSKSTDAAFVVFTSGSTGLPKGIVMEHGPFVSSARSHSKALRITSNSRVMQFAAYTYDVSMGEIMTTLMQGGCVCVPSEEERMSNLAYAVNKLKVNWMFLTPTMASFLKPADVPSLETLVLGGEHATEDNFKTWAEHVFLINSYGPAETAIWCACAPGLSFHADPASLGHPIGGSLWIVDANDPNILMPVGTVGELVVEGPILAREYLNDTNKTAAAFIENPKWSVDASRKTRRMYRTGDLARYGPAGDILFVGRRDTQTKIHGQRIELGEIEHHLMRICPPEWFPTVDILRFNEVERDIALCTFVYIRDEKDVPVANTILLMTDELNEKLGALRPELELVLPPHMVPSVYIPLSKVPLTAGGKVDRGALRRLGESLTEEQLLSYLLSKQSVQLPSTNMERKLQTMWAKVLGVPIEVIGADSNFLRIGGDSVASMKLSAAARDIGLLLTMKTVFTSPRLDEMSRAVEPISTEETVKQYANYSTLPCYKLPNFMQKVICPATTKIPDEIEDVLVSTDYQRWTLGCGQLRTRGYNNYFIFHLKGKIDVSRLEDAAQKLVDRHPILRTVFVAQKAELYQVVLKHVDTEFTYHKYGGSEVPMSILQEDIGRPVDLGHPSVRFLLIDQGSEGHRLMMRASHAQYDGISLPILVKDLKAAYLGHPFENSRPYHTFIFGTSQTTKKAQAEQFWRQQLEFSSMTHVIDHRRPTYKNVVNKSLKRTVRVTHTSKNGITFATIVKAAWSLVLSHLHASSDIVFGQITTGRNAAIQGIDEIVGPCMNLVPVRVQTSSAKTYLDLLQQVQNQHLDMLEHESLGIQHIIDHCTSWPRWSRFSSILQHTNFNVGMDAMDKWGDVEMHLGNFTPEHDVSDVWIWTGPSEDGFSVDFTYSEQTLSQLLAEEMLGTLCGHIEKMSKHPMSEIDSAFAKLEPKLPVPLKTINEDTLVHTTDSIPDPDVQEVKAIVLNVWKDIFGDDEDGNLSTDVNEGTPFYEIRGDLLAAAQLSMAFHKRGYEVSPEQAIDCPTIQLQAEMLSLKRRAT